MQAEILSVYASLVERAIAAAPDDLDYLHDTSTVWQDRLVHLPDVTSRDGLVVVKRLMDAASHPDLSRTAVVEWVDALPSAVVGVVEREQEASRY